MQLLGAHTANSSVNGALLHSHVTAAANEHTRPSGLAMMDPSRQPAAIALGKHGGAGTAGGPRKKYSNSMRHVQIADMIVEAQKSQRHVPSHDMRSVHHLQQHALHMHQQQMQNMRLAAGQGSIAGAHGPPIKMGNGAAAASQHALASQQQVQYLIQLQTFTLIILVSDHCSDHCVYQ